MAFRLFVPLLLIFFLFLYAAILNPGEVRFFYAPGSSLSIPYIGLVMASFLAGTLSLSLVYFFKGVGDLINDFAAMLRRWRSARMEISLVKAGVRAGQGNLDKAMRMVEKVILQKPEHFDAIMLRGDILHKMGRAKDALVAHSLALSIRPADIIAILRIKDDYRASGNLAAAYRLLEQVRGRDMHDAAILAEMRDISLMSGEFHRATVLQKEILALADSPVSAKAEQVKLAEVYCLYGEQLMAEGKFDLARENFLMASKVEPDYISAAMLLCDALLGLSLRAEAEELLKNLFRNTGSLIPLPKLAAISADGSEAVYAWAAHTRDRVAVEPLAKALGSGKENLVHYRCEACDAQEGSYFPQCPSCGGWNTAIVAVEANA